jgi:hypothetical protein
VAYDFCGHLQCGVPGGSTFGIRFCRIGPWSYSQTPKRCIERKTTVPLRVNANVIRGRLPSLTMALGRHPGAVKVTSLMSTLVLLALTIAPASCKRRTPLPPGAVVFEGTGVALVPGEQWQQIRSGPPAEVQNICLPVLLAVGRLNGAMIQVYSPTDRSQPERKAASLRTQVDLRLDTIKGSFKQDNFTTDSGLAGVHVCYDVNLDVKGQNVRTRNHLYIVQNARKFTVGVAVVTLAAEDSEVVHQMIRKTLRLQ